MWETDLALKVLHGEGGAPWWKLSSVRLSRDRIEVRTRRRMRSRRSACEVRTVLSVKEPRLLHRHPTLWDTGRLFT